MTYLACSEMCQVVSVFVRIFIVFFVTCRWTLTTGADIEMQRNVLLT